jgi:hypothetical protein
MSLRAWKEKQHHQQAPSHSQSSEESRLLQLSPFSKEEKQLLLSFIEAVSMLLK